MGAVLACGVGAVLSHSCAAALWGLIKAGGRVIDVTVLTRAGRSREGLAVHSGDTLAPEDMTTAAESPARPSPAPCSTMPQPPRRGNSSLPSARLT